MAWKRKSLQWLSAVIALGLALCFVLAAGAYYTLFRPLPMQSGQINWGLIHRVSLDLGWRLKPELTAVHFAGKVGAHHLDQYVNTDARGHRVTSGTTVRGGVPVLALGDSTTFGLGVEDGEAWPAQLESYMRAEGYPCNVMNAGTSGYSAFQGLRYLRQYGEDVAPQLVIVTFGCNDLTAWGSSRDRAVLNRNVLQHGLSVVGMLWDRAFSIKREKVFRLEPGEFLDTLLAIADWCAERDAKVLFLAWPWVEELPPSSERTAWIASGKPPLKPTSAYSLVFEAGIRCSAPVVDVMEVLDYRRDHFLDDVHLDAEGLRLVSGAVAEELRGIGLWGAAARP